jgi:hypothetical protein
MVKLLLGFVVASGGVSCGMSDIVLLDKVQGITVRWCLAIDM